MQFQAKVANIVSQRTSCAIVGLFEDGKTTPSAKIINNNCAEIIDKLVKQGDLDGKQGKTLMLHQPQGLAAERLLIVGLGKQSETLQAGQFLKILQKTAAALKDTAIKDICVFFDEFSVANRDDQWKASQTAKLLTLATYRTPTLKSKKADTPALQKGTYGVADKKTLAAAQAGVANGQATAEGMALAKDLGNLPGNICTPTYLAATARKLVKGNSKVTAKVLNEKQMRELGMGSLLSVSAGSDQEAQLIAIDYRGGKKADKPTVLVGKGITFDTGGISLKPGAGMDEMKFDMCGAASVLGTMKTIIALQLPINVVGLIAAAENMPSGGATKPGDIVTSMSGLTIEVLNTDAEGRLVLCDTLTYAERYKPKAVIDIATLTGACIVALGNHASGLYSNDDALAAKLLEAGQQSGDKAWQMPLWDEYQQQLDSNFADMANIGGPPAGSVTAACFLSRFAKNYTWAHLDIAGTAWLQGAAKGATGRPVPLLVEYLLQHG